MNLLPRVVTSFIVPRYSESVNGISTQVCHSGGGVPGNLLRKQSTIRWGRCPAEPLWETLNTKTGTVGHRPEQNGSCIFMLAWCAPANMTSTSKTAFSDPLCGPKAFRPISIEALGPSSRSIFMLAWCAPAHAAYFENSSMSAGDRAPLLNARHKDGHGGTPARAERVLHFHACVVCASTWSLLRK